MGEGIINNGIFHFNNSWITAGSGASVFTNGWITVGSGIDIDGTLTTSGFYNLAEVDTSVPEGHYLLRTTMQGTKTEFFGQIQPAVLAFCQFERREKLYLTAIDNLIKKNDYIQLTIQFDQELITEEEFDYELENNENKYLIKENTLFGIEDFEVLCEILPKINRAFDNHDISQMFSVPIDSVNKFIDSSPLTPR